MDGSSTESVKEVAPTKSSEAQLEDIERMKVLGLAPNKIRSPEKDVPWMESIITENDSTDEAKSIAAAALAAVKATAAAASGKGKVEIAV